MSKKSIKKTKKPRQKDSGVKIPAPDDGLLKFSFKFFDSSDAEVCPVTFNDGYTQTLMARLRDLSSWKVSTFASTDSRSVRSHKIDWSKTTRPEGFKNLGEQYESYTPWQFGLSANDAGRVHGLLIGQCFYVIWLDSNHAVYD